MTVTAEALLLPDRADSWSAAGFSVDDGGSCRLGSIRIALGSETTGWRLGAVPEATTDIDGLTTSASTCGACEPASHPNGVTSIDHIVVASGDLDRTTDAFEALGVELRRIRDVGSPRRPMQQRFFRMGDLIIEMVGSPEPDPDAGPAVFWGLALNVANIDATAAFYRDDELGPVKDAVQAGRRIATLRHQHFGMSLPIALMTPHVKG